MKRSQPNCAKSCNNKRFPKNICDRQCGGHIFLAFFGNAALNAIITLIAEMQRRVLFEKELHTGDCRLTGRFADDLTNLPLKGN
jgi:hypothetical protein